MRAVELKTGKYVSVSIDKSYHPKEGLVAIKFTDNPWVQGARGGTWYVNVQGYLIGGMMPDGYNARFQVIF